MKKIKSHSRIFLCNLTFNQNCFSFALESTLTFPKNYWLVAKIHFLNAIYFLILDFLLSILSTCNALYSNVQNLPIPTSFM